MKILLIIILVYIILALAGRYLMPLVLRYYMKRFSNKFYSNMKNSETKQAHKREGEIHIDYSERNDKSQHLSDIGEYVDYEEIK